MSDIVGEQEPHKLPLKVFLVGGLTQFALGLHVPFLNAYMVDFGANFAQIGTFRSVGNVAPTVLQPIWGATSDKVGHKKAFVAFGTLTGLFMVYLFLWAATPMDMIILYAIQSILFSIQIPTWISLVGSLVDENVRGAELGRLGIATNATALLATLIAGFIAGFPSIIPYIQNILGDFGLILFPSVEAWRESYYLPFYFTAIIGIVASILSLQIKEKQPEDDRKRGFPPVIKLLSEPSDFRRFCFVAIFFSFALSTAWPYFVIVQRVWLELTLLEIAIASAIMSIVTLVFTRPFGKLSDRVGRKPLIVFGRAILFSVPLLYAFATTIWMVIIAHIISGIAIGSAFNALTAYILDVAPEEERGSHLAVFNLFTGVIFLFGSLLSGLIGEALVPSMGRYLAVFTMLLASAVLRFIAAFPYILLKEPREYSKTVGDEFRALLQRMRLVVNRA
jgi:MFS family permease